MKKNLALFALLFSAAAHAQSAVPEKVGYQGRLLKADGTPESASVSLKFQLFDAATGGASLWTETQSVQPVDGFYSVVLGKTTAFGGSVWDGGDRWLELSVNGTALSPRQPVSSVPYAIRATNLAGGTVDATSIKVGGTTVIDSSGKLAGTAVKLGTGSGLAFDSSSNLSLLRTCADGQVLKFVSGAWTCAADNDTTSAYTAGSGISITGTTVAHADTSTQATVTNTNGSVIQSVGVDAMGHVTSLGTTNLDNRYVSLVGGDTITGDLTMSGGTLFLDSTVLTQNNLGAQATTSVRRSLRRLVVKNSRRQETVAIPQATLTSLCGNGDGCMVTMGMRKWNATGETAMASRGPNLFDYDPTTGRWRMSNLDTEATDGDNAFSGHVQNIWDCCYFTETQYISSVQQADSAKSMYLLNWVSTTCPIASQLECTIIIDD